MKKLLSIKDISWISKVSELIDGIILSDSYHGSQYAFAFDKEQLKEGIKQAKENNLICGILMTRMYTDKELDEAKNYLKWLKEESVDLIYYQDPAIYILAEELKMSHLLVYDPDTLLTNGYDMQEVNKKGISHGVVSKDLTLDEIIEILDLVNGKSEVIIFGYLKLSSSKRKFIQNYCDEINILNTASKKDDVYLIESTREGKMPIFEDDQGTFVYSDFILCAYNEFNKLKDHNLEYARIDSHFLDFDVIYDFLLLLSGKVTHDNFIKKYRELPFSSGYMYTKTNLVK
ncbi:MAG: U32 family peptidase [Anaerorhabdus sp.]